MLTNPTSSSDPDLLGGDFQNGGSGSVVYILDDLRNLGHVVSRPSNGKPMG